MVILKKKIPCKKVVIVMILTNFCSLFFLQTLHSGDTSGREEQSVEGFNFEADIRLLDTSLKAIQKNDFSRSSTTTINKIRTHVKVLKVDVIQNDTSLTNIDNKQNLHFNQIREIFILVLSSRENYVRRVEIRNTWARKQDNFVFIIGNKTCNILEEYRLPQLCSYNKSKIIDSPKMKIFIEENRLINAKANDELNSYCGIDMIEMPMIESYQSLPKKLIYGYEWILNHTAVKWILKADDDFVVRIQGLYKYVQKYDPRYTVIGCIRYNTSVLRSGKWAEMDYKPQRYPALPLGSCGHIVSRDIAEYLVRNKDRMHSYQGEDTSLAIWLNEAPFSSNITYINSSRMVNDHKCKNTTNIVIGHEIKPALMKYCLRFKDFD